jgi:hypothetical protein
MAQAIRYKRPRKVNVVSVTLAAIAVIVGYLISQYLPIYLRKQEAYRVLDETSSQFSGAKNRYLASEPHRLQLEQRMGNDLRLVGIDDPEMEHWIEVDDKHTVRFGVLYSETVEWPWDVIAPQTEQVELEYVLALTW